MDASATALSQFVILAQSAQGRACEALIRQALDSAGVFVFGELLDCPNVKALDGTENQKTLELLRIFAFGTYADYKVRQSEFGELSVNQKRKLQMLTLVSMATKDKLIKFSDLEAAIDVSGTREVEDLIIEAVYQNLIVGKMDQENQCLIVESCACRDCRDEDIDYIIETLTTWQDSAQSMMQALEGMVKYSQDSFEQQKTAREDLEKQVQATRESLKEGESKGGNSGGGITRMPQDDADEESKRAKSTRGRWVGGAGQAARGKH
mmetsp:Transcript_36624/g.66404  ORF Transcript_36624/g.66404 Transcript_36624/m.66404 type:complete len:265 (-) Transcript_36624:56-850(-)|eukprot:CAMPEP_0197624302 /NCGR_PEP_ID=MMETSP1338-20131121/3997_1 /TAXON_ID=43686 ORGANISM="Pelagodinium beii, Strain RCC1491" /NCGR_SAMPLE_ID=MMETSP1338 /ASSEMBLY_ACC=CAM_ASM_000754 /LENGTH=264 /DNA_ID=CAMNT_0043194419 /DNA_START=118 /DNA_END=912 /DNA_ORIENTATION=-